MARSSQYQGWELECPLTSSAATGNNSFRSDVGPDHEVPACGPVLMGPGTQLRRRADFSQVRRARPRNLHDTAKPARSVAASDVGSHLARLSPARGIGGTLSRMARRYSGV